MDERVPEMNVPTYPFGISEPPSSTGTPTAEPADFNSEPVITNKPPVSPMRVSRFQVSVVSETKNDSSTPVQQQQPVESGPAAPTADGPSSNNNTNATTPTVSAIRKGRFSVVTHKSEDVEDVSSSVPTPTTNTACSSSTDLSHLLPKANAINQMPHHQPLTSFNQLPSQPGQYYVPGQAYGPSAFVGAVPSLQVCHDMLHSFVLLSRRLINGIY